LVVDNVRVTALPNYTMDSVHRHISLNATMTLSGVQSK
jgi:hypothetical protein